MEVTTPASRKSQIKSIEIIQGSSLSSFIQSSNKGNENDDELSINSRMSAQFSPQHHHSKTIVHQRSNTLPSRHRKSRLSPIKSKPESINSQSLLQIPSKHRRRDDPSS